MVLQKPCKNTADFEGEIGTETLYAGTQILPMAENRQYIEKLWTAESLQTPETLQCIC